MLTWLYPYFVLSACLMADQLVQRNKSGPYDSLEEAQQVVVLIQVNYKCGAYVERDWVWAKGYKEQQK